ncbi:MAG: polysaccharide biosynthesis protein, partial [Bacteroidaceae bacterium]|nr:polysaccharide biosynthesis protein [Bacteroidaceae bacterium]
MGNFVNNLLGWYFSKNAFPYWVVLLVDAAIVVAAGVVACCLVQGTLNTLGVFLPLVGTWCCYLIFFLVGFRLMHTYSGVVRYSSFIDLMRIAVANLIGVVLIFAARHIFSGVDSVLVPISAEVLLTCSMLATAAMWSVRIVIKYAYDVFFVNNGAKRVFIYGVKEGGVALAKSIHSQQSKFVVRGFVSDEPNDWSHMLMGCRVYPNDDRLVENMRKQGATVLMVSPLKTDEFRNNQAMISSLSDADVQLMVYRGQSWDGKTELRHEALKDVDIEDLLPRNQIEVDMEAIGAVLSDKCVMITGAAGSIGSEIVRQVATFGPSQMVLVDQAETPLHNIRLMMAHEFPGIPCLTLTASITNQRHMETTFAQYRPEYVFHAAAYKHVPMMEDNPGEAVMNNILGTRIVADLAVKYGARKFVMVSTDKAVNPTNVMGCSKRICEMYCQSLDKKLKEQSVAGQTGNAETPCSFVTTRFGNVLGSNGSVIPIFQEQIKAGGPLTVTHPDIIRYFMLIPEA